MIFALLTLILGLLVGFYSRELLNTLKEFIRRITPLASGIVRRNNEAPLIKAIDKNTGAVRAKTPKEIAVENERKFNEKYGL